MENISIKGHVQIFDENNNLVTEADNMVVESGRLAVRKAFIEGERFKFYRILLGEEGTVTYPSTAIAEVDNRSKAEFTDITLEMPEDPEKAIEVANNINEPLKLRISFSNATYSEYMNCKELSLTICKTDASGNILYKKDKDGNATTEPDEVLFSRVVFSGYPFTKDHTYTMLYSVYF